MDVPTPDRSATIAHGNGRVSFGELREGLLRLRVVPAIALTEEDFDRITDVLPPPDMNSILYEIMFNVSCIAHPDAYVHSLYWHM